MDKMPSKNIMNAVLLIPGFYCAVLCYLGEGQRKDTVLCPVTEDESIGRMKHYDGEMSSPGQRLHNSDISP